MTDLLACRQQVCARLLVLGSCYLPIAAYWGSRPNLLKTIRLLMWSIKPAKYVQGQLLGANLRQIALKMPKPKPEDTRVRLLWCRLVACAICATSSKLSCQLVTSWSQPTKGLPVRHWALLKVLQEQVRAQNCLLLQQGAALMLAPLT